MPAMSLAPAPIPTPVLYSLLKAVDPAKALKGQVKSTKGVRLTTGAKRSFTSTLEAAQKAKTPQQFASLMNGGAVATAQAPAGWGAITELTVQYTKDGYTIVTVRYANGPGPIISIFPTT